MEELEKEPKAAQTVEFTDIPDMLNRTAKLKKEGWKPEGYPDIKGTSIKQLFIKYA